MLVSDRHDTGNRQLRESKIYTVEAKRAPGRIFTDVKNVQLNRALTVPISREGKRLSSSRRIANAPAIRIHSHP
jgi:hypothetical protein